MTGSFEAVDNLVFETYTKHTMEPSWVFEELAEKVTNLVATRCVEIAHANENTCCNWQIERAIRREFGLEKAA